LLCAASLAVLAVVAPASGGITATTAGSGLQESGEPAFLTGPSAGQPLEIALEYLKQNLVGYGLELADIADMVTAKLYVSRHTGTTHIHLRQRHGGIEVYGATINANVAKDGSLVNLGSSFVGGLAAKVNRVDPVLSREQAAAEAARALGLSATARFRVLRELGGPAQAAELTTGGVSFSPIPIRLVHQPTANGQHRLAWMLEIEPINGQHWWNARIDATTGELLAKSDYVAHEGQRTNVKDGASYKVFAIPKESPDSGRTTREENPAAAPGSPWGWHDTDMARGPEFTITRGNNAHAYLDTIPDNTPDPGGEPEGGSGLDFAFKLNLDKHPSEYTKFAVTNLYYWNNVIHDVFWNYGFDEASGNFQVNNYGRGGLGNDQVRAEAQDGSGQNNANFGTPPDGSPPRMQMYIWTFSDPHRDSDLDAGVIVHEYGHGISTRLTGDNVGCLNNREQAGEGWSDWFAMVMTPRRDDTGPTPRGMGTYVFDQERHEKGIRPTQYSTDMDINPATYDTIKTSAVPHGVGYVWATITWEVYWNLVTWYGFNPNIYDHWSTGGNNLAVQLIVDGLKLQPCSPGFVDSRDAILLADQLLTGGENKCLLWRGFAKRGLGKSADQGSSFSNTDGTEAFDLPKACR
jgi:extracellular elastinolytic metalloproteinase